ncbi:MAG: SDR family NAD(P)-dependent oxidoreductase [Actinomycetota bacterium]|nr:SDR family NAD(P)-dependent oxidoreductase [Actinomycetota bacterium]MDG2120892.1 SDR family NAD(P)-dependent oxidoreductase [Actinomycetota bacterium]
MGILAGRVALVTGAQQGIGRAVAEALGSEGASVVVQYLDDQETAAEIAASIVSNGSKALIVQGDVGIRADCAEAFAVGQKLGGIDLLVNNAGIFPRRDFLNMTEEDWNTVQNVNVLGGVRCLQIMANELVKAERKGTAVNLSSVAFFRNSARGVHYAASKGAIIGFTRSVSAELAPYGIRVNAIAPGIVDTAQPRDGMTETQIAQASKLVPLGAMGKPEEIADVAVFLSSHASRHMTGQTIQVNGGTNFS